MSDVTTRTAVLDVDGISSGYGDVTVLQDISFSVHDEIFTVLGANGAGKTTLLATLARLVPLTSGSIVFQGEDVSAEPAYETAGRGIGYVPQDHGVFPDLTVMENLTVGGMIGGRPLEERREEVMSFFPDLRAKTGLLGGTLSGGESRMVACGRALMQDPKVLLLDEPTAGLAPMYVELFFEQIHEIREARGVAIVLAEQNASKALEVADRVIVLDLGRGSDAMDTEDLTTDQLKKAYRI